MGYENAIRETHFGYRGRKAKNLVGIRSGRLVANEYYGYEPTKSGPIHYWRCLCNCGGSAIVNSANLTRGTSKSCGCLKIEQLRERSVKHGLRNAQEYTIWANMRNRCNNPNNNSYERYGGRGIKVCDRWDKSFSDFFEDMGERPSPKHSIERRDVNGDYEPENCVWATALEQGANKRVNRRVIYDGKEMILAEAIRKSGLPEKAVSNRLSRGWSAERALTTPLNAPRKVRSRPDGIWVEVEGERMLLRAACTKLGKNYGTVFARIKYRGWPVARALSE